MLSLPTDRLTNQQAETPKPSNIWKRYPNYISSSGWRLWFSRWLEQVCSPLQRGLCLGLFLSHVPHSFAWISNMSISIISTIRVTRIQSPLLLIGLYTLLFKIFPGPITTWTPHRKRMAGLSRAIIPLKGIRKDEPWCGYSSSKNI